MNDRHQIAALGARVKQPALAVGDYLAPIGDDPTIPGPVGHCRSDGHGLYSIHWFDRYGDFTHRLPVALGPIKSGYQRISGPRPLAPRPPDLPSTINTAHQALCDLVIEEGAQTPAEIKDACAFLGALSAADVPWPPTASQAEQARDRVALTRQGPGQHVEQPAPLPGTGDVWQEVIDGEPLAVLRELYGARRALGLRRYGHLLQRDNGRDHALDGQEELLDGIAYFTAAGWYDVVAALRTALLCVVARRGAA